MLQDTDLSSIPSIGPFAVAIAKTAIDQTHLGILYRDGENKLWFLHLAWNYKLLSRTFPLTYQWLPTDQPSPILKFLAVICDNIRKQNPPIPYGLSKAGILFSPTTGEILRTENGTGLTCASFILAIFSTYNLQLFKEEEWPEDANMAWQEKIVFYLIQSNAPPEQVQAVSREVGQAKRFTPSEVLGASAEPNWPIGFTRAAELAQAIDVQLRHHTQHAALEW